LSRPWRPLGRRQMRPIGDGLVLAHTRYLAVLDAPVRGWPDTNDVQRRLFRKFESKNSPFAQGQIEQSLVACPILSVSELLGPFVPASGSLRIGRHAF
jgi:hypothetical protein